MGTGTGLVDGATGVPPISARVGDVVALTVAVTHPVEASKACSEKATQAVPSHQVSDWPPGPRSQTLMVTELNAAVADSFTS